MRIPATSPFLGRWALFAIAALLPVLALLALVWTGESPAGADDGATLPGKLTGLEATAKPGSLDVAVEWDGVDRADSYLVRWREAGSDIELNEGVRVESSEADIAVAGYGDWVVRVEACNAAGCGSHGALRFTVEPAQEPTPTPTPEPAQKPKPEPTATPAPIATPTPEPTVETPGLEVALAASADTLPAGEAVTLRAVITNAPEEGSPSYKWEFLLSNWNHGGSASTFSFAASNPGVWKFRVKIAYGSEASATSEPVTVTWTENKPTSTPMPPDRPTGLRVATEPNSLDLSVDWDDVEGADEYLVRWREAGPDAELNDGVEVESSNADITVADYGRWAVRVEACNGAGCGLGARRDVTVKQLPPGQPQSLAVSVTPGDLNLSATWNDVEGADFYWMGWRRPDGGFEAGNQVTPSVSSAAFDVAGYGQWVVRVEACNGAGCGPGAAQTVSIAEPEAEAGSLSIAPVLDEDENPVPGTFRASWEPVAGADAYRLRWRKGSQDFQQRNEVEVAGGETGAVFSVDSPGLWKVELRPRTPRQPPDTNPPTLQAEMRVISGHLSFFYLQYQHLRDTYRCQSRIISGIDAEPVNGGVYARWDAPGVSISKYQYYAARPGRHFLNGNPEDWVDIPNDDITTNTDTGAVSVQLDNLDNGETYWVELRGVSGSRIYCFQKMLLVTPGHHEITAPGDLAASNRNLDDNSFRLSWTPAVDTGTGTPPEYDIQYQHIPPLWHHWESVSASPYTVRLSDRLLDCNADYYFRVRAKRASGTAIGPYSTAIHVPAFVKELAAGGETWSGSDGPNCIEGKGGNDVVHGGDGDDRIHGGGGDDELRGENGDDDLLGGPGNDELHGGDGNDYLYGGYGSDLLIGGKGNDDLNSGPGGPGSAGTHRLTGGPGDDYMTGIRTRSDHRITRFYFDATRNFGNDRIQYWTGGYWSEMDEIYLCGGNQVNRPIWTASKDYRRITVWYNSRVTGTIYLVPPYIDLPSQNVLNRGIKIPAESGETCPSDVGVVGPLKMAEPASIAQAGSVPWPPTLPPELLEDGITANKFQYRIRAVEVSDDPWPDMMPDWIDPDNSHISGGRLWIPALADGTLLTNGTEYQVQSRALDAKDAEIARSLIRSFIPSVPFPTGLTVVGAPLVKGAVDVSWDNLHDPDVTIELEHKAQAASWPGTKSDLTNNPSPSLSGLTSGVTYDFRLLVKHSSGNAGPTEPVSVKAGLYGTENADTLDGDAGVDYIVALGGNDTLKGLAANDELLGGPGDDTLNGGDGDDTLDGGDGKDTASYADAIAAVTIDLRIAGAQPTGQGSDTLISIECVTGSNHEDEITGDALDNCLTGGDGNDTLTGLAGADTLDGGDGNDTANYADSDAGVTVSLAPGATVSGGHAQGDTLANIERIAGSAYADTLTGDGSSNTLRGNAGDDILHGGADDDGLYGNAGDDTLNGGGGDDNMNGGAGNDILNGGGGGDTMFGGADDDTLNGGAGSDHLGGDTGDDTLYGGADGDTLHGNAGDDTLSGNAGADTLDGGAGNDTADYSGAAAAVTVSLAITTAQSGAEGGDTLSNIENLTGSAHNDTLTGDATPNTIKGGAGRDTLSGGDGRDELFGGDGGDHLSGGNGNDTLEGGPGTDNLGGGSGDDTLVGGSGNDLLRGNGGHDTADYSASPAAVTVDLDANSASGGHAEGDTFSDIQALIGSDHDDTLTADSANNRLTGGAGADTLDGGAGVDYADYSASNAAVTIDLSSSGAQSGGHAQGDTLANIERITGSTHADTLTGDSSDNLLDGHDGDDTLNGGAGVDTLNGGNGNDTLNGEDGNDRLWGRAGDDAMSGGAGTDAFFFYADFGNDTISDYLLGATASDSEALNLCMGSSSNQPTFTTAASGNDLVVTVMFDGSQQGTITLTGRANDPNKANINVVIHPGSAACSF